MEIETEPLQTNYTKKVNMILDILTYIEDLRDSQHVRFVNLKNTNTVLKSCVNVLNVVSISNLIVAQLPVTQIVTIIALCTSSSSGLITALLNTYDIEFKINAYHTTYLQLSDLYRDISARLKINNLSSHDLDIFLNEINGKLGLIEDNQQP